MYGHDSQPSAIWSYGCKPPALNGDLVAEQMRLAHRYRNALVERELTRRSEVDAALREMFPDLAAVEMGVRAAELVVDALEERADLRAAKRWRGEMYRERRERRSAAFSTDAWQERQASVDADDLRERKALRAACGLYWGTYLAVEQSMGGCRRGRPPKFHRWRGDGKLAVQIQGGRPVAEMYERDSRLFVARTPERSTPRRERADVWMRIGSAGRGPVWTVLPTTLHRPLPAGSRVKWAYLIRRRVGTTYEWRIQFVVAREGGVRRVETGDGTVAVDLGWRMLPDGLRVAYWVGDDGREGQMILGRTELERWPKADDLRSIRDRHFGVARDRLVAAREQVVLPEWMDEEVRTAGMWRATGRLARLVWRWGESRPESPEEMAVYDQLEAWRQKDKHLLEWEAHQRQKAVRWRDDAYRQFAADLRKRYGRVVVEDADWRQVQRRAEPGDEEEARGRHLFRVAAVGRLRQILAESGMRVVVASAEYTTQRCHMCGYTEDWGAAESLTHRCTACGAVWDQDANAAWNLLADATGDVTESHA